MLSRTLPALRVSLRRTPACAPRFLSSAHESESFEAFTQRYTQFFNDCTDLFELQRGLNNCFAYDLVPAPETVEAALRAARRVHDYPTAVRIMEGVKEKVETERQYQEYQNVLQPVLNELGVETKEQLGV